MDLEAELAILIAADDNPTFTADDLTFSGTLSLDPDHSPNGAQSAIGRSFRIWAQRGLIEWTGDVVKSQSPRRRKGLIRVWAPTDKGREWAQTWMEQNLLPSLLPPPSTPTTS